MKMSTAVALDKYMAQEENRVPVRVVKTKKALRARRRFATKLALCLVALTLLMAGTVYSRLVLTETKARINDNIGYLTELESKNAYLSYQLESLVSLKNAEDYAVGTLGLVKLDSRRIEYVSVKSENAIEANDETTPLS
ncbi:MAG: hypothetical protein RSB03_02665, partial [Oscillospiraceae bacterium]